MVSSLEVKIGETEKKYEETNKLSEERLKQATEAESKLVQLKTAMHRLCGKGSEVLLDFQKISEILTVVFNTQA